MSEGLTLAAVIARGVAITWPEAVAVVREVAERSIDSSSPSVPELQQIVLTSAGDVQIAGSAPSREVVRRLGQLLHALITRGSAPVQLRLVISQATAPQPAYGSVREFFDALAYFDRPQHEQLIRDLYERTMAAPDVESRASLDDLAPLPAADVVKAEAKQKKKERAARRLSRASSFATRAGAVALFLMLIGAAGFRYAKSRGLPMWNRQEAVAEAVAVAERASDTLGQSVVSGFSAVSESLGLGRLVPPDATPSPPPGTLPAAPPAPSPVRGRRPLERVELPRSFVAFDLERPSMGSAGTNDLAQAADESESRDLLLIGAAAVYSPGSAGVAPPVGIRPQLARQLPPDIDPAHLGRIELIIGEDGTVESAKLIGPPRDVKDSLFISVVKAWDFQPALKDGVPVKYRKTIWIVEQ